MPPTDSVPPAERLGVPPGVDFTAYEAVLECVAQIRAASEGALTRDVRLQIAGLWRDVADTMTRNPNIFRMPRAPVADPD